MTYQNVVTSRMPLTGLVVFAALLAVLGGASGLSAQNPSAHTPNMVGEWVFGEGESCSFTNVWDPAATAQCGELPGGTHLRISEQYGRAFAGSLPDLPGSKFTGVIGEDGTFLMQGWIGNNRLFYSGQLSFRGHVLRMTGTSNEFEDWLATIPSMSSSWFTATKIE